MTQRTDIHRPSAIQPEDYDFIAVFPHDVDGFGGAEELRYARETFNRHMECHPGAKFSGHEHGGFCMVCGNANALTYAVFYHEKTNSYVRMGQDCANKMDMNVDDAFRRARTVAEAMRKSRQGKLRAQGLLAEYGLTPAWDIYAATDRTGFRYEESTITDIVAKLVRWGSISDAQKAFVSKLLGQITDRAKLDAERAAKAAASQHIGTVGNREKFTLTIRILKSWDGMYGTSYLHVCDDARGGTVVYKGSNCLGQKGDTLTVVATISEHGEYQGEKNTVIKRPKVQE